MSKKILSFILVCFLSLSLFTFAGCGTGKQSNVTLDASVSSNGSIAVVKDNYLFCVDGYQGYSVITDASSNKNVSLGKLVRIKINEDGSLETNENGEIVKTVLSDKLCGFEYTNLFIYDDYIYFSSPNTYKNSSGEVKSEYVTFYKTRLDGNYTAEIYTATSYTSSSKYIFTKIGSKVYLIINIGGTVTLVDTDKPKNAKTIIEGATDVVMPVSESYTYAENDQPDAFYTKIYYTHNREDKSLKTGNLLYAYDLTSCKEEVLFDKSNVKISLKTYANKCLYYTLDTPSTYYYYNDLSGSTFEESQKRVSYMVDISNVMPILGESAYNGVVFNYDSKTYSILEEYNALHQIRDSSVTAVYANDKYAMYVSSNNLNIINYDETNTKTVAKLETKNGIENYFDIIDGYIYFYATPSSSSKNYYLYRASLEKFDETKGQYETTLIGTLLDADKQTEESTDSE